MQDVLLRSIKQYGNKPFLGSIDQVSFGKYNWKTLNEISELIKNLGTNINKHQLYTPANDFENFKMDLVGIFAKNREEWLIVEYSNFLYRKTMVPL